MNTRLNSPSGRIDAAFLRIGFGVVAEGSSLRVADADEDGGVPGEKFSPRLCVSVRGFRWINSLFSGNVLAPDFFGILQLSHHADA